MEIVKSKYRSTPSDDHLDVCLRLATSNYNSDYTRLAVANRHALSNLPCQLSFWIRQGLKPPQCFAVSPDGEARSI
ncbi:hypothetical protein Hamer_G002625, partial [Homarus americanus]